MKPILYILCLFLAISCKKHDNASVTELPELKLDHGNKWQVNPETQQGIVKMDSIINAFKGNNAADYNILGNLLAKQSGYIIKNCTMEGEPHDQLHVVLMPMLEDISTLKESGNEADLKQASQNLNTLIQAYYKHFEP